MLKRRIRRPRRRAQNTVQPKAKIAAESNRAKLCDSLFNFLQAIADRGPLLLRRSGSRRRVAGRLRSDRPLQMRLIALESGCVCLANTDRSFGFSLLNHLSKRLDLALLTLDDLLHRLESVFDARRRSLSFVSCAAYSLFLGCFWIVSLVF